MPDTPLTRRNHLPGREPHLEPVGMATQSVDRLRKQLGRYEMGVPAVTLRDLLTKYAKDPLPQIETILGDMREKFCAKFETNAQDRFELAEAVYYRLLENILRHEMTKNIDWKVWGVDKIK